MNIRKVVILNALLYIATFLLALVVNALKGTPLEWDKTPVGPQIFVAMVIGIILTTFGAWWYFRSESANTIKGLLFGIYAILIGLVMDMIISVGIWTTGQNPFSFLQTSYSFWFFGFMLVVVLIASSFVAWLMAKQKNLDTNKGQG